MNLTFKEKLKSGDRLFGTWIMSSGLDTAEILSYTGVDCIMIDAEHGSMDIETAGRMVSLIRGTDTAPLMRVPWNDLSLVKRGLDTGISGLMMPMINLREDAEKLVQYCKYPPFGVRGQGAGRAVLFGATAAPQFSDYWARANDDVLVIGQIEHYLAVENVEEILSVPSIDVAFVGPGDLSMSMGYPGQMNHPEVQTACKKVIKACEKYNVVPAMMTWTGGIEQHLDMGFRLLLGGIDGAILYNGVHSLVDEFHKYA